jgi:hypothetical protein
MICKYFALFYSILDNFQWDAIYNDSTHYGFWICFVLFLLLIFWIGKPIYIKVSDEKGSSRRLMMTSHAHPRQRRELSSKVVKLTINDLLNAKPSNGW